MRSKSARLPAKINIPRSLFPILKVHNFIKTKSVLDKILIAYCIKLRGVSFGLIYGHEYKIRIFAIAVNQGYSIYSITKFGLRIVVLRGVVILKYQRGVRFFVFFQKQARLFFTARINLGTAHTITSNNQLKPGTGYTNYTVRRAGIFKKKSNINLF